MRHSFKIETEDETKEIGYGYDAPTACYFIQIYNLDYVDDYDFDPSGEGFEMDYSTNPHTVLHPLGKVLSVDEMITKLRELGCTNEEHLGMMAMDLPF